MIKRRLLYLAILLACLVFFYFYQAWFAAFFLICVCLMPFLSLLISLPALLTARVLLQCPTEAALHAPVSAQFLLRCALPQPPVRGKLRVRSCITGEEAVYAMGEPLPTEHCGQLQISVVNGWLYDYLGLFRRPIRDSREYSLLVLPKPIRAPEPPQLQQYLASMWRPKPGGGFSENHELRLYRPGDNLRQIHWKLAAKTGKLIVREPMEPLQGGAILRIELSGSEDVIDEKLGKLLWVSQHLLDKHLPHQILCLTGNGILRCPVSDPTSLQEALTSILTAPMAPADAHLPKDDGSAWCCQIGGDRDEV